MTVILLNKTNFDRDWAAETLVGVIRKDMKAVMMPLSYDEGWSSDRNDWSDRFREESEYYEDLIRPFLAYGIRKENIRFIDQYEDDAETVSGKLEGSDLLCIFGYDPDDCMDRIEDMNVREVIRNYRGILMGISAGSKIITDRYYHTPDELHGFAYREGIGRLSGFDIDTHYFEDEYHLAGIIRCLEDGDRPVLIMPDRGGALISGESIELFGNAFIADYSDIDELYQLYNEISERN